MSDKDRLLTGVIEWNRWRFGDGVGHRPNLSGADLSVANLSRTLAIHSPRLLSASCGSGYQMVLMDSGNSIAVHAGCHSGGDEFSSIEDARTHWTKTATAGREKHCAECLMALDFLEGLARRRGWKFFAAEVVAA